ncbi:MAG: helix-hairpin-helix domain-containing protein [Syntrophomonadaceae bacterium]|jgi:competence protein ComEA
MIDLNNVDRRYLYAAAILLIILVFSGGFSYSNFRNARHLEEQEEINKLLEEEKPRVEENGPATIKVYVTGEVKNPRVCELEQGARVLDAVEQVELLPGADIRNINMARVLQDGEAVVIPAVGQNEAVLAGELSGAQNLNTISSSSSSARVNINTAPASELDDKLPGIGPTLAERIVAYRTSNGPFTSAEDLKNVNGIGDSRFAQIKDLIVVR